MESRFQSSHFAFYWPMVHVCCCFVGAVFSFVPHKCDTCTTFFTSSPILVPLMSFYSLFSDSIHFQHPATFPMDSETHSGEDVAIYARGPMAHLLTGVKEQNVIAYVMAHAACVGDTGISCEAGRPGQYSDLSKASALAFNFIIVVFIVCVSFFVY